MIQSTISHSAVVTSESEPHVRKVIAALFKQDKHYEPTQGTSYVRVYRNSTNSAHLYDRHRNFLFSKSSERFITSQNYPPIKQSSAVRLKFAGGMQDVENYMQVASERLSRELTYGFDGYRMLLPGNREQVLLTSEIITYKPNNLEVAFLKRYLVTTMTMETSSKKDEKDAFAKMAEALNTVLLSMELDLSLNTQGDVDLALVGHHNWWL